MSVRSAARPGRVYRDLSWFHKLIGKTRPYNIKNYKQPKLKDMI